VPVGEGDFDSVWSEVGEPGEGIGCEAGLGLFAVGDDGGAGLFKPLTFLLWKAMMVSMSAAGRGMLPMGSVGIAIRGSISF
jgi:hypothetical protein